MGDIVAPQGSPLAAAVLGVESLKKTQRFYTQVIGLEVLESGTEMDSSTGFHRHWGVEDGMPIDWAVLSGGPDPVGRILLLQFHASNRRHIRGADVARGTGLFNLNFYTDDIRSVSETLRAEGYEFWSDPVQDQFGPDVGEPIEVVFEGPDGVPINLVELATKDPATRIGQMRAFVDHYGRTSTGFTPVVTTSHGVVDRSAAIRFYQDVTKMAPLIDETLGSPDSNRFLRLAPDARTHVTFMQGNHMFGKVVLAEPLNYTCASLTERAVPPNIGYIAQSFQVDDLDAAAWQCAECGADVYSAMEETLVPGFGTCASMIVRNPGSGALQQLFSPN